MLSFRLVFLFCLSPIDEYTRFSFEARLGWRRRAVTGRDVELLLPLLCPHGLGFPVRMRA